MGAFATQKQQAMQEHERPRKFWTAAAGQLPCRCWVLGESCRHPLRGDSQTDPLVSGNTKLHRNIEEYAWKNMGKVLQRRNNKQCRYMSVPGNSGLLQQDDCRLPVQILGESCRQRLRGAPLPMPALPRPRHVSRCQIH